MPEKTRRPERLRSDARRNRSAILDAGRELFTTSSDVAMCQIARRAGVGQATLYRHFPDRDTLVAEIIRERIERVIDLAEDHRDDPDAFFILIRALVDWVAGIYAVAALDGDGERTRERIRSNRALIGDLMQQPIRTAKAAGTLRRDLSVDDVLLILRMARGAMLGAPDITGRSEAGHRALTLVLEGLAP